MTPAIVFFGIVLLGVGLWGGYAIGWSRGYSSACRMYRDDVARLTTARL